MSLISAMYEFDFFFFIIYILIFNTFNCVCMLHYVNNKLLKKIRKISWLEMLMHVLISISNFKKINDQSPRFFLLYKPLNLYFLYIWAGLNIYLLLSWLRTWRRESHFFPQYFHNASYLERECWKFKVSRGSISK